MELLHIVAKSNTKAKLTSDQIDKLPRIVGLASTVQYLHIIDTVKEQLPEAIVAGQVLGCNVGKAKAIAGKVNAFLYIGTGEFHPIALAMLGKTVFIFNPESKKLSKLGTEKIDSYKKRIKGAELKFLTSKVVGILVSTKKGQNRMKDAKELEKRFPDKKFYMFVSDMVNIYGLEDFPFIESWVNTACPRMMDDFDKTTKSIINIDDI